MSFKGGLFSPAQAVLPMSLVAILYGGDDLGDKIGSFALLKGSVVGSIGHDPKWLPFVDAETGNTLGPKAYLAAA